MTIYESLKAGSIDEFVEWLNKYVVDDSPWIRWFDDNYCKKCDAVSYEGDDYAWCERNNKCKFFQNMTDIPDNKQIIKMWLEREIEDEASI